MHVQTRMCVVCIVETRDKSMPLLRSLEVLIVTVEILVAKWECIALSSIVPSFTGDLPNEGGS